MKLMGRRCKRGYVRFHRQMTAGQLIDNFIKLNFHVNFCLREVLEELPRVSRLLEPMGRICDLLQAESTIEPSSTPAYVDAAGPVQLAAVLERCHTLYDSERSEQRSVVSCETLHGLEDWKSLVRTAAVETLGKLDAASLNAHASAIEESGGTHEKC